MALEGPGVLEIKCPINRGRPQEGRPPPQFHWYYVPQVRLAAVNIMDVALAAVLVCGNQGTVHQHVRWMHALHANP